MNIRCLFGHTYSVVHPDKVFMQTEFGFCYHGVYAVCERCKKKIESPYCDLPMIMPRKDLLHWERHP